jgi:predicted Zn-dependent protease
MTSSLPHATVPARFSIAVSVTLCLIVFGCSIQPKLPAVVDHRTESLLRNEAASILEISEDRDQVAGYQFLLSDFPRKDILGMSVGDRRIYISYTLASLALYDVNHLWLLRQTVAHEIAHETAAHAKQRGVMRLNRGATNGVGSGDIGLSWYVRLHNYSAEQELEADRIGLQYWGRLGWDCRIWVSILQNFQKQNYTGDVSHPTDRRLQQAESVCAE